MPTIRRRLWALAATVLTLAVACVTVFASSAGAAGSHKPAVDCQPFSGTPCLLPFPNNLFTIRDRSTPTGLRVHLPANAMPVNKTGVRMSVAEYDRNDGFSPGSAAILHVPGLDNAAAFKRTGSVGVLDMKQAFAKNQPIVVIDEATGQRQLIYSQLDANAPNPQGTNLMIVPGKEFTDGHTYVVALRNLRTASGKVIAAPGWFEKLRDGRRLPSDERSQLGRYKRIFAALGRAGIARSNLYEAWDFTVGSQKSLTSRLLSIRNNAFAQLGDTNLANGNVTGSAPAYTITSNAPLSGTNLRDVQGSFQVPCYLITCGPTATTAFHYSSSSPDALPTQIPGNVATAQFDCIVPSSASPSNPSRISLYGHGLLGSLTEVKDPWVEALATNYNMTFCATDWWGLASGDTALAAEGVTNLNLFPAVVDRLQQGVLNFLFLGRLMDNPRGFASNPAFQSGGQSVIDTSHLYYDGNSQGGIEGGLTTAVSPDFRRAVLGVTGIDYGNMLIQRSTDFAPFKTILEASYTDQSLYPVITDLIQQLWDRGDPDGYAANMTSRPLPDTPSHTVLMQIAYGDFQVSMYAGAAEARTIGADVYQPALDSDRSRDRNLFYGIPAIGHYPFTGSAVEIWDSGPGRVQPPPVGNVPPTAGPNNIDPHQNPRNTPAAQQQISDFLEPTGAVVNVCGGKPCHSSVFTP
ncbi:MAG TPA: hypothetical protein VMP89_00415 [Solirubrobacteraceae bacterium]|nr:hypothetical protein [Solirubrobacteraceae bacterium]